MPAGGPGFWAGEAADSLRSAVQPRRRLPSTRWRRRAHRRRWFCRGCYRGAGPSAAADLVRAVGEVARFVSTHLALAELDASRTRTVQAQLNFLRAQISPHFVYNALTAIESFVRSDPDRARDLLLGFAEFTRSTFREHSQYVTLAEELHLVETTLSWSAPASATGSPWSFAWHQRLCQSGYRPWSCSH